MKNLLPGCLIVLLLVACQLRPQPPSISQNSEAGETETTVSLTGQPLKGSQPAIYRLMENGRLRHIGDWPTYLALGYQPDDIIEVSDQELYDPAAWFDSAAGDRTLTIQAVEAMTDFERKFSWDE